MADGRCDPRVSERGADVVVADLGDLVLDGTVARRDGP